MPAYYPLNHNRLLELENHLRRHRTGTTAPRQALRWQSTQRWSYRELVNKLPTQPAYRQSEPESQALSRQPQHARLGESESAQHQVKSDATRTSAVPRNPQPRNPDRAAGSYRQLARELGKHHSPRNSLAQPTPDDLPAIRIPIERADNEGFAASLPPTRRHPSVSTPVAEPTSPSSNPPSRPKWKELATTIRQARLGITDTEPEVLAAPPREDRRQEEDKVIDEVITQDQKFAWAEAEQASAPITRAIASVDEPSRRPLQESTSIQDESGEVVALEKHSRDSQAVLEERHPGFVTIDVTPAIISANEIVAIPPYRDTATAVGLEESSLHPAPEVADSQTDSRPEESQPSASGLDNPNDVRDGECPIPTADRDAIRSNFKNRLRRFYRLTWRPRIVKVLAHIQRKKHKYREAHGQA